VQKNNEMSEWLTRVPRGREVKSPIPKAGQILLSVANGSPLLQHLRRYTFFFL